MKRPHRRTSPLRRPNWPRRRPRPPCAWPRSFSARINPSASDGRQAHLRPLFERLKNRQPGEVVLELTESRVSQIRAKALGKGEQRHEFGRFAFTHDLLRRSLEEELSTTRRARFSSMT